MHDECLPLHQDVLAGWVLRCRCLLLGLVERAVVALRVVAARVVERVRLLSAADILVFFEADVGAVRGQVVVLRGGDHTR